jgi:pyridinium-3,5-biscarboxylic acid mononucleotide sulfurtransferase
MSEIPPQAPPELSLELAAKRDGLIDLLRGYGSCAVAYSGGLDSTVLAKAAYLALGDHAVAVTGTSASMAADQLDEAKGIARKIGIRHEIVATGELAVAAYYTNDADRCYHCKNELFACVEEVAQRANVAVIVEGSNRDDLSDYRPGLKAAKEWNVKSPLIQCELTKAEIRLLAESWKLSPADKPATPCLSSRIAYGEQVTSERLSMIDRAEQFLRRQGFQPVRVRYHKDDVARIEVAVEQLPKFADHWLRSEVIECLKSLGFKYVAIDLEGFRSGSMNAVLLKGMAKPEE